MIESGKVDSELSNIYFFLPYITDKNEDKNKFLKNVSISPIDITQQQFNKWAGVEFNSTKLDFFEVHKTVWSCNSMSQPHQQHFEFKSC